MIFLHPPPNLEAAVVLYLMITIIFQVYSIKIALSMPLGQMHF